MHPIARLCGRGLFKGFALVAGMVIIAVLWLYDASILIGLADANLRLVKWGASYLPADYSSKTEAALRLYGIERALLLIEVVAAVKLVMLGLGLPFRTHVRRTATRGD